MIRAVGAAISTARVVLFALVLTAVFVVPATAYATDTDAQIETLAVPLRGAIQSPLMPDGPITD